MRAVEETKKEFLKIFNEMCYSRSAWQVWADLMSVMACSIANAVDKREEMWSAREKEYEECIKRLGGVEKPAKCFAAVTMALEENPDQDFLGELYMTLNLGNHWKGQFFTPYHICEFMSKVTICEETSEKIEEQGFIAVNDFACGAGATLIATANTFKGRGINYQRDVLFVAQDIDRIVGMMCYIQLSLLGCAGYVVIANTITNPICGDTLFPTEKEGQEFWYTPMWATDMWQGRILWKQIGALMGNTKTEKRIEIPKKQGEEHYFFFDFKEELIDG